MGVDFTMLMTIVHDWTVNEVEKWLVGVVNLSKLVPPFRRLHVTGRFLPW